MYDCLFNFIIEICNEVVKVCELIGYYVKIIS